MKNFNLQIIFDYDVCIRFFYKYMFIIVYHIYLLLIITLQQSNVTVLKIMNKHSVNVEINKFLELNIKINYVSAKY